MNSSVLSLIPISGSGKAGDNAAAGAGAGLQGGAGGFLEILAALQLVDAPIGAFDPKLAAQPSAAVHPDESTTKEGALTLLQLVEPGGEQVEAPPGPLSQDVERPAASDASAIAEVLSAPAADTQAAPEQAEAGADLAVQAAPAAKTLAKDKPAPASEPAEPDAAPIDVRPPQAADPSVAVPAAPAPQPAPAETTPESIVVALQGVSPRPAPANQRAPTNGAAAPVQDDAAPTDDAAAAKPAQDAAPQARNAHGPNLGANQTTPSGEQRAQPAPQISPGNGTETVALSHASLVDRPAAPGAAHASAQAGQLPPAAASIAQQIVRRFDGGSTEFQIRLDPPELGRVDVRIEVSRDKKVTATIAADSPQTLQEFVRSARELQRVLTEAGVDLADNGLTFSDRRGAAPEEHAEAVPLRGRTDGDDEVSASTPARPFGVERWNRGGVDLWV
jgi:flagellar hook-length control protein FliK